MSLEQTPEEKLDRWKKLAQYVLDAKTFGEGLFTAKDLESMVDDDLTDFVCRDILGLKGWCGTDPGQTWGFEDLTWDSYDTSIEFKGCVPGFEITPEQKQKLVAVGITHGWICYNDGSEKHF